MIYQVYLSEDKDGLFCEGVFSPFGTYPSVDQIESIIEYLTEIHSKGDEWIQKENRAIELERIADFESYHSNRSPAVKQSHPGFVYLIKSNGVYKIGKTKNLENRLRAYTTQNPFGIDVVLSLYVSDYSAAERELLSAFDDKRYQGEWFTLEDKDVEYIKSFLQEEYAA
jgi:Meiotically up-regulated gene 113